MNTESSDFEDAQSSAETGGAFDSAEEAAPSLVAGKPRPSPADGPAALEAVRVVAETPLGAPGSAETGGSRPPSSVGPGPLSPMDEAPACGGGEPFNSGGAKCIRATRRSGPGL